MNYSIQADSRKGANGTISINRTEVQFGTTPDSEGTLVNPAELFLCAFATCILKSVERFSGLMNFKYSNAHIDVSGTRSNRPPKIETVSYKLSLIGVEGHINIELLKKNIERHGTIFNTVKSSSNITGEVLLEV